MRLNDKTDETDLLDIISIIWDEKIIVSFITALSLLVGFGYLKSIDPIYKSKIRVEVNGVPPFYTEKKALKDFELMFFSKKNFDNWKNENSELKIEYSDLDKAEDYKGFLMSKNQNDLLVDFNVDEQDEIIIKEIVNVYSKNLSIINDIFNYMKFIDYELSEIYLARAKIELLGIESRFKDLSTSNPSVIKDLLGIERFISTQSNGRNILVIDRPTKPTKTYPITSRIISVFLVMGLLAGIIFVFYRRYKLLRKK
tara:strand:+ start:559 stop:1323 length:765 start_codon:yes stop_codon:yes gene_type:complete